MRYTRGKSTRKPPRMDISLLKVLFFSLKEIIIIKPQHCSLLFVLRMLLSTKKWGCWRNSLFKSKARLNSWLGTNLGGWINERKTRKSPPFDRESLSGCRAQGDLESIPSLPVASLDMASGSSQVPVKEPIVGKSHKYEVNDLVSSFLSSYYYSLPILESDFDLIESLSV